MFYRLISKSHDVYLRYVLSIYQYGSALDIIKPEQETDDGAFAAPGVTNL